MSGSFTGLYNIATLAAPAAFVILAILVYLPKKVPLHNRIWSAFCLFAAGTYVSIHIGTRVVHSADGTLFVARLGLTCGASACFSFLTFATTFLNLKKILRRLIPVSAAFTILLITLFWSSRLVLGGVKRFSYGTNVPEAGPLMPLYLLFVVFHFVYPSYLFFKRYRRSTGIERLQIGYIILATLIIGVAALGTLLPIIKANSLLALVPMLLMVIAPSLITYAIIRYQLWDIRTVIHKTVLWVIASLVILVPVVVLLDITTGQIATGGINGAVLIGLVLFILFAFHFNIIQPWIDQRFARRVHDPIKVLDKFNHEVLNLRGVKEYADLVVQTVKRTLYADPARVRVIDSEGMRLYDLENSTDLSGERWAVDSGEQLVHDWLIRHNSVVDTASLDAYELTETERGHLENLCRQRHIVVAVPFVHEGNLLGLLELGEKQNLKAYTREDFRLLEQIRSPATVAMANSLLYDKLHELTLSLEHRVQQRTRELKMANEQLQELDRQKSKFFANITHELKTPLTLILAPLEDLMLDRGVEEIHADLKTMYRNGLKLMRQINSLLDLAKIDAGTMRLKVEEFKVGEQLESSVRSFSAVARRKSVELNISGSTGDEYVLGDAEKLDLVWANLLANAIKFTDPGGSIRVRVASDEEWFVVTVEDTGIGIPKTHLDRIFDRFAQVDSGPTRRYEGAGIGLSLVKEILRLHKGTIEVASEEGKGTRFTVRLPRRLPQLPAEIIDRRTLDIPTAHTRRAEDRDPVSWVDITMDGDAWVSVRQKVATPQPQPVSPAQRETIMVVDDNADLRNYIAQRLDPLYQIVLCEDGKVALDRIQKKRPDLVVMDVMMPELSGFDLCRILREKPETADIPIILVTARRGVDRALEGFQAGANDYLTKPFNIRELVARIQLQLKLVDLSRQLAQREKGTVLNLVAAGLAHEVRNPANAILNAIAPLEELYEATPQNREAIEELFGAIRDSAGRIDLLCSDLLGLSRPDQDEVSEWQFSTALDATLRILGYKHGFKSNVVKSLNHHDRVVGHTARLNQVLLNLLDNAMRAAGPEGHLWVTTEQQDGDFCLTVGDDGPGIAKGDRDRVFDPLYSTYFQSGSSGLGLYITRTIVEEHYGTISVNSSPGGGAEFTVKIPLSAKL